MADLMEPYKMLWGRLLLPSCHGNEIWDRCGDPVAYRLVCLSVCHAPSNCFFFFVSQWNQAIFGRFFSMWHSTKRCSSIFDLCPLTPKIYSPKLTLWVIESVIVYMDVCHGSVGQSVHTKTCMWVAPTLVAMATRVLSRNYGSVITGNYGS